MQPTLVDTPENERIATIRILDCYGQVLVTVPCPSIDEAKRTSVVLATGFGEGGWTVAHHDQGYVMLPPEEKEDELVGRIRCMVIA